jgi:hypothetical protein
MWPAFREEMAEQGELAEQVIAVLLENGRLRLEQVVAGVAGKMGSQAAEVRCRGCQLQSCVCV